MKKIILIYLVFLTLCRINTASAHAVLTNYSLKIAPIHAYNPAKVELLFNSQIELNLSQFFLISKGDRQQLLSASTGAKQGQIIINIPPLATGDYALKFIVLAADGHLTQDNVHFSVSK
jgi:methionine-rich copper-binding protein CopC